MGATKRGDLPDDLARGRCRFQAWRARRHTGGRIPQHLWALAVKLVQRHGVSRTATALGLDYYSLKRQATASAAAEGSGPAFVEVATPAGFGKHCLLELNNGAGATLRAQLGGYDAAEIAAVARSLWCAE
jgi:hypothetical protein